MNPDEPKQPAAPEISPTELPEPPDWNWKRPPAETPKPARGFTGDSQYQRGMGLALAIGSSFIGPVLAGILIGALIDGRVGGIATMVGLLVGFVLAFVLLLRLVNRLNSDA